MSGAPPGVGGVFRAFLGLGCFGFGGPMAHIALFRRRFVDEKKWIDAAQYDALVALAQLVPGPASSQVGFALGWRWAGWRGAMAAFAGFTLPSALLMTGFGLGIVSGALDGSAAQSALRGLLLLALAVVADALLGMARRIGCKPMAWAMAVAVAMAAVMGSSAAAFAVFVVALVGLFRPAAGGLELPTEVLGTSAPSRTAAVVAAALLGAMFAGVAILEAFDPTLPRALDVALAQLRAGALVFGGGHVVLPLLQAGVVDPGWIEADLFAAGYGAAQAVPGPMFSLAAYLGAVAQPGPWAPASALLSLIALFAPGLLFIVIAQRAAAAFRGRRLLGALGLVHAAVVGLLAVAMVHLALDAKLQPLDVLAVAAAFAALRWRHAGVPIAAVLCIAYAVPAPP